MRAFIPDTIVQIPRAPCGIPVEGIGDIQQSTIQYSSPSHHIPTTEQIDDRTLPYFPPSLSPVILHRIDAVIQTSLIRRMLREWVRQQCCTYVQCSITAHSHPEHITDTAQPDSATARTRSEGMVTLAGPGCVCCAVLSLCALV